ncbi:hypothetical protein TBLA_0F03490 [Henningerozyma blattae CBS 6284]|uniref:SH3 domain-containing protein n=1 Tax=Henningerozyma blattae (strain ATCC 34711 / CBS 6284 / DSM 70876 / NBRC 10599 / NRRL Y-10934 / UCD 77-7) TaxID=1071380 RepID=I2H684_HENB6|nr:hypothetical protein TBLA_0F03490 [Tetrapisispora blattae CBS 6284]CCH61886.1 hypothetical protein TBLA_0F03490 [Tetrapisispora blattae CBS 6284]
MGLNNPVPRGLKAESKKAANILRSFVKPNQVFGQDQVIPPDVLKRAKGLAVITVLKAGFLFSGRAGSGVIVARLRDGTWSAPSGISMAGAGAGGLVGVELTDFVFILNTTDAVKSFSEFGTITLGGNVSVSAGPLGRNAEAAASASTGGLSSVFAYSKSKGLFAGISVEGSVIVERRDANAKFYGRNVNAKQILGGKVRPPPAVDPLFRILESRAFNYKNSYDDYYGEDHDNESFYADIPDSFVSSDASSARPNTRSSRWRGDGDDSRSYREDYDDDDYDDDYDDNGYDDRRGGGANRGGRGGGRGGQYLDDGYDDRRSTRRGDDYDDDRAYGHGNRDDYGRGDYGSSNSRNASGDYGRGDYGSSNRDRDYGKGDYGANDSQRGGSRDYYQNQRNSSYGDDNYRSGNSPRNGNGSRDINRYSSGGSYDRQAPASPPGPSRMTGIPTRDDAVPGSPKAVALYSFTGEERGDLSFRKGDVITIIKKSESQNDWWTGRVSGREGIFPANYVELV